MTITNKAIKDLVKGHICSTSIENARELKDAKILVESGKAKFCLGAFRHGKAVEHIKSSEASFIGKDPKKVMFDFLEIVMNNTAHLYNDPKRKDDIFYNDIEILRSNRARKNGIFEFRCNGTWYSLQCVMIKEKEKCED